MYVQARYNLTESFKQSLRNRKPNFGYGLFGEVVYYRSYSRRKADGSQEHWADTVIRTIEGIMSIRLDWHLKNNIFWDHKKWQQFAEDMTTAQFNMEWMPPGRGLWAMGSDMMYERGSMCLYNCAFTQLKGVEDLCWLMDALMCGVGVGFEASSRPISFFKSPYEQYSYTYTIPDSREGWVDSLRHLLKSYMHGSNENKHSVVFDYHEVRPVGSPIKGFGGTASGPEPLRILHEQVRDLCEVYVRGGMSPVRFYTDVANMIGVCVVAGNVRRSAEIGLGSIQDDEFMDLKDYTLYPERAAFGWMSNNSVKLHSDADFDRMQDIASRVINNGEPGYLNMRNVKYGRLGHRDSVEDYAIGLNPCGEIPLEDKEVCNVADTLPTRCGDHNVWIRACQYATFYTSTVALLPTHHTCTNAVVTRNRRIGVGIIDYAGWKQQEGLNKVIKHMRRGYKQIRHTNEQLAKEAGVRDSIRVTTIKPGGSTTKQAGRQPGIGHPNFRYMIRRIRVQKGHPIEAMLITANVPCEPCANQPDFTTVFEFPVYMGETRTIEEVDLWEQALNLVTVQREWADNAVSNTLVFKHKEKPIIEHVLSAIAPMTKSVSLLEYSTGAYKQMPEEGITPEEYHRRVNEIHPIDWSTFRNSDGVDEKFCDGDKCTV